MRRAATPILALSMLTLLTAQAHPPAGPRQPRPQPEAQRHHDQRHRDAPPVQPYRGPHDYRPGRRPPQLHRPPHFDHRDYRRNYRAERRYRMPRYVRPNGWYFHRWIFGDILPSIFWSRSYWIADYWRYGLPIPPAGYVWVRYGDDALLIDRRSGEILQVIYGIFY